MTHIDESLDQAFDRLQRVLLAMRAGDELAPGEAARASGLTEEVCLAVLERLTRAGLMSQEQGNRFVRRTLEVLT